MKRLFFILLFLNIFSSYAQKSEPFVNLEYMDKRQFQWGYYFGTNYMDFKFDYKTFEEKKKDIEIKKRLGFNVGLIGSMRIMDNIHLRIEPGLVYNHRDYIPEDNNDDSIRQVKSTYLYFPMLVKISTERWYNFKPYITGGGSIAYNLSSSSKFKEDNSEGRFRMKDFTLFYEIGFGIDFYTPYFRVSPSIRGIFSLGNEIIKDKDNNSLWTGNVNRIRTQGILINLTFE